MISTPYKHWPEEGWREITLTEARELLAEARGMASADLSRALWKAGDLGRIFVVMHKGKRHIAVVKGEV